MSDVTDGLHMIVARPSTETCLWNVRCQSRTTPSCPQPPEDPHGRWILMMWMTRENWLTFWSGPYHITNSVYGSG